MEHLTLKSARILCRSLPIYSTRYAFNSSVRQNNPKTKVPEIFSEAAQSPPGASFRNMFDENDIIRRIRIEQVRRDGFYLSNRLHFRGPILIMGEEAFLWDVPQGQGIVQMQKGSSPVGGVFEKWTPDSFSVFQTIVPKPELLVFGTGATFVPLPPVLRESLFSFGIQLEQMATWQAVSTYNMLAEEGRRVAAALLPPVPTSARTGESMQ
ncbi:uncharacterized protein VTP21DRAFT_5901 [Calcarisporiella thermophila]|uniref:uncharacterized protein n=1 Tax=Calcarisporiella thermophila TaxID=911321 RepID=UPI0037437F59